MILQAQSSDHQIKRNKVWMLTDANSNGQFDIVKVRAAPKKSELSCVDLHWHDEEHMTKYGDPHICAAPKMENEDPVCGGPMTFNESLTYCEIIGARMCTIGELDNDNARGVGDVCGYDYKQMWSTEPCLNGKGHFSRAPSSNIEPKGVKHCHNNTHLLYTMCCADAIPLEDRQREDLLIDVEEQDSDNQDDVDEFGKSWSSFVAYGSCASDTSQLSSLANMSVECNEGSAVFSFHLTQKGCRKGGGRLEYECGGPVQEIGTCVPMQSDCMLAAGQKAAVLTKLKVECPTMSVLRSFTLRRGECSEGSLQYMYTCCGSHLSAGGCSALDNPNFAKDFSGMHPKCLDKKAVMAGFEMSNIGCGDEEYQYRVKCCTLGDESNNPYID
eukprot:CAMPEP_0167744096 /NCGR_PEP_ID=MMETSP0110_2-20121227/2388_1 /TAXON_ID=629695 /ORGANISM="Gymnochlora sp., Strain CCMP2014" /LENGTH=384 /DNA_ID=CAMNT_0007628553 /DNA_START=174 /DNA_END=1325 /DNA_ORIENTATION=-